MDKAPVHWPSFLRELDAAEQVWRSREVHYPREDAVHWMPYAIPQFVTLLTEAVAACARPVDFIHDYGKGISFIDIGCGPGTKCRLAQAMFGLDVFGIDIVARFVGEAQAHGISAQVIDAFDFAAMPPEMVDKRAQGSLGRFDIVLVNRPSGLQDELEGLIMEGMASDAVLIAVNWRNDPGKAGWFTHYQEFGEPICGVFIKP